MKESFLSTREFRICLATIGVSLREFVWNSTTPGDNKLRVESSMIEFAYGISWNDEWWRSVEGRMEERQSIEEDGLLLLEWNAPDGVDGLFSLFGESGTEGELGEGISSRWSGGASTWRSIPLGILGELDPGGNFSLLSRSSIWSMSTSRRLMLEEHCKWISMGNGLTPCMRGLPLKFGVRAAFTFLSPVKDNGSIWSQSVSTRSTWRVEDSSLLSLKVVSPS